MPSLSLYSAGSNARGQLATGDLEDAYNFTPCVFSGLAPGALPAELIAVEQVACGANHTLALLHKCDGKTELWGCGDGAKGQLGPSYNADVAIAPEEAGSAGAIFRPLELGLRTLRGPDGTSLDEYMVRLIAAGWETSYVVVSCPGRDDVLLSMGANDFGNLGVGRAHTTSAQEDPKVAVYAVPLRGILPSNEVDATVTVLALCAGPQHTIVQIRRTAPDGFSETYLVGWGTARHGQLGPIPGPSGRPAPFTPSPHLLPVASPEQATKLALGNQHTVLLRASSTVTALGSNRKDQLSGLDTLNGIERVGCTWNGTYALLRTGEVVATGSNTHSQLGRGAPGSERQGTLGPVRFPFEARPGQFVEMVCGSEHVLCIVEREGARREVWGWGWNEHGNLGTGATEDVGLPLKLWPRYEEDSDAGKVINVWAGCGTSWILVER